MDNDYHRQEDITFTENKTPAHYVAMLSQNAVSVYCLIWDIAGIK